MLRSSHYLTAVGIALAAGIASPASAQATRTWVSGVGDDVNPCSRTAPCKTFAGAISKTAAGGEINCLDPGGFGAVTITKSMTITCQYTEGGALAGGNGIVVNDSATATPNTAVVFLRGLDIFGVNPPSNGVRFISGKALHIEESTIRNFNSSTSYGVSFQPSGSAQLVISDSVIGDNGGTSGGGVLIKPTGTGRAAVQIISSKLVRNTGPAVLIDTTGNTGNGNYLTITNSLLNGNTAGLSVVTPVGTSSAVVSVVGSTINNNSANGIVANGATNQVRVTGTTITNNGSGLAGQGGVIAVSGAGIITYGDNLLYGNTPDGAFTSGPIVKN